MNIGQHILVDGKSPATIRYIGLVDHHPGEWIGIEWWNCQQGKHNGTYQGKIYFQTKSSTSGSFIRPERIHFGHSFSQAIYRQYIRAFSNESLTPEIDYSIFGKQYSDYQLDLSSIQTIDLSTQWLNQFDINEDIYKNLQQIRQLNIRQNLLKNWSQLWKRLEQSFSQIEILNVSNCRMNFDENPTKELTNIQELVLIDTDNDCETFENILRYFPRLTNLHLDLNRLTYLSENFVNQLMNLTNLSLSDNPTLKSWNPSINYLGKLKHLEELIVNNCQIDEIILFDEEIFPSLKYLYLSDNRISSYRSINELFRLPSLISLSLLRNPIYPSNDIQSETNKQMIIARLPNLIYFNRVFINRDDRRGAEIDYLQRFAQQYFEQNLDFVNEHRNYRNLIDKYGEPIRSNSDQTLKKGLCIRPSLLKFIFEYGDENPQRIEKKIPISMSISKLKTFVRRLFPLELTANNEMNLYLLIDSQNKQIMSNDYQDLQFYLANDCQIDQPSVIKIEKMS